MIGWDLTVLFTRYEYIEMTLTVQFQLHYWNGKVKLSWIRRKKDSARFVYSILLELESIFLREKKKDSYWNWCFALFSRILISWLKYQILILWDERIRTFERRDQNPVPYRSATPHFYFMLILYVSKQTLSSLGRFKQLKKKSIRLF